MAYQPCRRGRRGIGRFLPTAIDGAALSVLPSEADRTQVARALSRRDTARLGGTPAFLAYAYYTPIPGTVACALRFRAAALNAQGRRSWVTLSELPALEHLA